MGHKALLLREIIRLFRCLQHINSLFKGRPRPGRQKSKLMLFSGLTDKSEAKQRRTQKSGTKVLIVRMIRVGVSVTEVENVLLGKITQYKLYLGLLVDSYKCKAGLLTD